jgi:hypothetical protein
MKPWEKYQQSEQKTSGPWEKYQEKKPWEKYSKQPVQEEIKAEDESKTGFNAAISQNELDILGSKYKLNDKEKAELEDNLEFFGAYKEGGDSSVLELSKGFLGEAILLGIPQKMAIQTASSANLADAMDELRELAKERQSGWRTAAEIGAGLVVPGGGISKLGKLGSAAAVGAGTGALAGYGQSRSGEEVEDIALGTGLGLGLGIGGQKLIDIFSPKKLPKKAKEIIGKTELPEGLQVENLPDTLERIDNLAIKNKPMTNTEFQSITTTHTPSTEEMTNVITHYESLGDLNKYKVRETSKDTVETMYFKIMEKKRDSFETFLKKDLDEALEKDPKWVENQWERFLQKDYALQAVTENGIKNQPAIKSWVGTIYKFSDNRPLAKVIDARLGTKVEEILDDISEKYYELSVVVKSSAEKLETLSDLSYQKNVNTQDIYEALNTGNKNKIDVEVYNGWKQFYKEQRNIAESLGLPIDNREFYVPKRRKSGARYKSAMDYRLYELAKKYNTEGVNISYLNDDQLTDILSQKKNGKFKEFFQELEFLNDDKIEDAAQYNKVLNDFKSNNPNITNKLHMDATATFSRKEGEIPSFVKEKDINRLSSNWVSNTMRTAVLRNDVAELKKMADIAAAANDMWSSKHLNDLAMDLIGGRKDTLSGAYNDMIEDWSSKKLLQAKKAREAGNDKLAEKLENRAEAPNIINKVTRNAYPNYLGYNIKSALQNLTSPIFYMFPDLGPKYVKHVFKGYQDVNKIIKNGVKIKPSKELFDIMQNDGKKLKMDSEGFVTIRDPKYYAIHNKLMEADWVGELEQATHTGIIGRSAKSRKFRKGAELAFNKGPMFMFTQAEAIARVSTNFMSKHIVDDMFKTPSFAIDMIKRIDSPIYQNAILKAWKKGPEGKDEVNRLMAKYLTGNYLFHYNKANMSAYGRYMGPMFSMFTKWPTSIVGRVASSASRGKLKPAAKALATPFATMAAVDTAAQYFGGDEDWFWDRWQKAVGREGFTSWTGASSIVDVASEGVGSPPIEAMQGVIGALSRDGTFDDKFFRTKKELGNTFKGYMPGAVYFRVVSDDIPTYVTGKRRRD